MATNRDLLKEAIADAKAVKETAIANAKAALEEAFTPFLKEKLSAKLTEMEEEMEEDVYEIEEKIDEMKKKEDENMMDEEISLDELLAELDEYAETQPDRDMDGDGDVDADDVKMMKEAKDEEEMSIEDMSEDDLKSFIEDVIKDMVSAGELEAGEAEEGEEMGGEEEAGEEEAGKEEMKLDEEFDINELLAELDEAKEEDVKEAKEEIGEVISVPELTDAQFIQSVLATLGVSTVAGLLTFSADEIKAAMQKVKDKITGKKSSSVPVSKEKETTSEELAEAYETVKTLKSELNEINLLNAKLLYTNKIFRNKSLTESQKVKVLTAFDKATSKQEAQLVYETLLESLKVSTTKAPIKESLGSASKVLGGATSKPIIENDAFARMRELAFGGKK